MKANKPIDHSKLVPKINCHDELVQALKDAAKDLLAIEKHCRDDRVSMLANVSRINAENALARVEGVASPQNTERQRKRTPPLLRFWLG